MATLELPVRSDLNAYEFTIDLEQTIFTLSFRFNVRKKRWIMDISDSNNEPLVMGIVLLESVALTDQYVGENLPKGRFFAMDETGEGKNPEEDDLGNDVKLYYLESEET